MFYNVYGVQEVLILDTHYQYSLQTYLNYFKMESKKPQYTLTYFDIWFRGEYVNAALVKAGADVTIVPVDQKDWPAMKPTTPSGFLPILQIDGGE